MPATEGQRLILNDGTTIVNGNAGYAEGSLWLYFSGMTMANTARLMCDPGLTVRIVYQYGEMETVYEGFTECTVIMVDIDGQISVCLKKAVQ